MNKKSYTLFELINEVIVAEGILKTKASVHMAHASSSKSKGRKKKKGSKQAGKQDAIRVNKARKTNQQRLNQRELVSIAVKQATRRETAQSI